MFRKRRSRGRVRGVTESLESGINNKITPNVIRNYGPAIDTIRIRPRMPRLIGALITGERREGEGKGKEKGR